MRAKILWLRGPLAKGANVPSWQRYWSTRTGLASSWCAAVAVAAGTNQADRRPR